MRVELICFPIKVSQFFVSEGQDTLLIRIQASGKRFVWVHTCSRAQFHTSTAGEACLYLSYLASMLIVIETKTKKDHASHSATW
jgi:hypothetical protein